MWAGRQAPAQIPSPGLTGDSSSGRQPQPLQQLLRTGVEGPLPFLSHRRWFRRFEPSPKAVKHPGGSSLLLAACDPWRTASKCLLEKNLTWRLGNSEDPCTSGIDWRPGAMESTRRRGLPSLCRRSGAFIALALAALGVPEEADARGGPPTNTVRDGALRVSPPTPAAAAGR